MKPCNLKGQLEYQAERKMWFDNDINHKVLDLGTNKEDFYLHALKSLSGKNRVIITIVCLVIFQWSSITPFCFGGKFYSVTYICIREKVRQMPLWKAVVIGPSPRRLYAESLDHHQYKNF